MRKLVTLWLYWTPEPPPTPIEPPSPTPQASTKKGRKKGKGVKAEKDIKPKVKPEPVAKRPRPISTEIPTVKRPNTTTRRQTRFLQEAGVAEEEEVRELPTLAQLLGSAEGTGEYVGEDPATVM